MKTNARIFKVKLQRINVLTKWKRESTFGDWAKQHWQAQSKRKMCSCLLVMFQKLWRAFGQMFLSLVWTNLQETGVESKFVGGIRVKKKMRLMGQFLGRNFIL